MKTLYLMRHAKSDQSDHDVKEKKRSLTKKGERQATRMGEWAKEHQVTPNLILTSPAIRATQTAQLLIAAMGYTGELREVGDFYMAEADEMIDVLKGLADEVNAVMIVGHNPGLESLIPMFTKKVTALPTASIACLELPIEHWGELKKKTKAELCWLETVKEVKKEMKKGEGEEEGKAS
jgi:phosphohistidine phosphatase